MNKLNYVIDDKTKIIIMELYQKAKELDIGNVNFKYYGTSKSKEIDFQLTEYKHHWELTVMVDNSIDVYKIKNDLMSYDYSEVN